MIEGLRVAPAYLDARADNRVPKSCDECRASTNVTTRQYMGCGFEAPVPAPDAVWSPSFMRSTVCPGYTTALPVVQEVLGAHVQWRQRTLTEYLGAPPTDVALTCLAAFESGINEHSAAEMRKRAQKGGA